MMLILYVEAPFAAFRTFTAGWYRPTATFLTPSAAYGLVLNVAGIDSRLREEEGSHDGKVPATLMRRGLPLVELAIGVPEYCVRRGQIVTVDSDSLYPRVQSIFQQLHNYPVGASGAARAESTKGNKYNITPVRRELVSGFRAVIALRENDDLVDRVRRGLEGEFNTGRFGAPFLGDNAFLIDRLVPLRESGPVRWYERITHASAPGIRDRATRLTVLIDRADLARTSSSLYAPQSAATMGDPPPLAWTAIDPPKEETPAQPARRSSRTRNK
jgi:CRISPR-associated protein Cas5t